MENYKCYRSWMYDRMYPGRRGLKPLFEEGVKLFITWAFDQECCRTEGGVRCPCLKCGCRRIISDPKEVETHLKRKGFKENYWVWTSNGEEMPMNMPETSNFQHGSSSRSQMEYEEQFNLHDDMIGDALGVNAAYDEQQDSDEEELPNEKAQNFYELLKEINTPLFEGSSDSKLSMCVRLLAAKSNWNVPDQCLEFFCQMMLDATPTKDNLPRSYYDAKRLVMKLGLEVRKIDCCIRDCMLFYDNEFGTNDGALEECKFCNSPRYVVRTKAIDRNKKRISIADHAERMAVAKRRTPLMQELHERTYRGRDGEYCDDRARDTQAEYQRLMAEFLAKHPELGGPHGRHPIDPAIDQYLWLKASKGRKRNGKIYGAGPLAGNYKKGDRCSLFRRIADGEGSSRPPTLTPEITETIRQLAQSEAARENETLRKKQMELEEALRLSQEQIMLTQQQQVLQQIQQQMQQQMQQLFQQYGGGGFGAVRNQGEVDENDEENENNADNSDPK